MLPSEFAGVSVTYHDWVPLGVVFPDPARECSYLCHSQEEFLRLMALYGVYPKIKPKSCP